MQAERESKGNIGLTGPLNRPVVIRAGDVALGDSAKHRAPGRRGKNFGFFDKDRGIGFRTSMTVTSAARYTPRHKHVFDQVRYIVNGQAKFGRTIFNTGDCLYFPEGVAYGPEDCSMCPERIGITIQFPGPTGIPYPHPSDAVRARSELANLGNFEDGIFVWPDGRKQDGHEAVTEYLMGKKLEYPSPRYPELIAMHSDSYFWEALPEASGIFVKHLGFFNEVGPNIKMLKIEPGAATQPGVAPCQQVRYLLAGSITFGNETYDPISCMYFPADVPYGSTFSSTGATLLVVQLASPNRGVPPFCLI
jgi:hypothetical protein